MEEAQRKETKFLAVKLIEKWQRFLEVHILLKLEIQEALIPLRILETSFCILPQI